MKIVKLQPPAISKIMKQDTGMKNKSLRVSPRPCALLSQWIN